MSIAPKVIELFRREFPKATNAGLLRLGEIIEQVEGEAKKERKRGAIQSGAEEIYALYPRKVGKEDALIAISLALKKHEKEYLLDKTNQFAEAVNSWPSSYRYFPDGGDRCPNPGTFYRQGRYADDPSTWRRHGAKSPAPHQRIAPPEPDGWRQAFPEFVDRDKPWNMLQPAQQSFILNAMNAGASLSALPQAVSATQHLRQS